MSYIILQSGKWWPKCDRCGYVHHTSTTITNLLPGDWLWIGEEIYCPRCWAGNIMRVVDAHTIVPSEIQPGDVMMLTVKAMVTRPGRYRLYRCPYPRALVDGEIPQGSHIINARRICEALFPSLARVAVPDL